MNLFNTSMFSNFAAERFDFNKYKLRWITKVDVVVENFIQKKICLDIDELWLFGLDYFSTLPKNIQQQKFTFPSLNTTSAYNEKILISDSWAFTVDTLFSHVNKKHINFCIHASYLANLNDPRPLLLALKKICLANNSVQAIIIKDQHKNNFSARKWSDDTLLEFLNSSGFSTRVECDTDSNCAYFIISLKSDHYQNYLANLGLSAHSLEARELFISTEDSSIEPSGGIGTYIKNIKSLTQYAIFLYCNKKPIDISSDQHNLLNTFLLNNLICNFYTDTSSVSLDMVEAIKVILFALPYIEVCEIQDHLALGFRVVQAKQTGQLPQYLHIRTFLHGNIDHIKFAEQKQSSAAYTLDEIKTAIKDAFIYKYSDSCRVPSEYLRDLMSVEFGYTLNQVHLKKLPFNLASLPTINDKNLSEIRKIIFIGKYSYQKGWPDFVDAIEQLDAINILNDIDEIISLSPDVPAKSDSSRISAISTFSYKHLTHHELLTFIASVKHEALFIIPSRGENYPYALLELILTGSRFITYRSGGSVELARGIEYKNFFFVAPTIKSLVEATSSILTRKVKSYDSIINSESNLARVEQLAINFFYQVNQAYKIQPSPIAKLDDVDFSVTITTPVYNTPFHFLEELFQSICCSSIMPLEWLLIDDGSTCEYAKRLDDFVSSKQNELTIRLIRQKNMGLSSARNQGLMSSNSKYTLFIDSDDVLLPHTIGQGLVALQCSPELVAVSGFSLYFTDAATMPKNMEPLKNQGFWSPLGIPEAKTLSLLENQYIPSCILTDTQKIRATGGWDEQDKSTWEDWAFFSHLAWNNYRFSLIPNAGFLYRNTPGSMSKTYNQYLGRRRLIRNVSGLSKLDANILTAMAMAADPRGADGEHRLEVLLQNTYNSHSWKITAPLRFLGHHARIFKRKINVYFSDLFKSESI